MQHQSKWNNIYTKIKNNDNPDLFRFLNLKKTICWDFFIAQ
jgi:hypothetical protein